MLSAAPPLRATSPASADRHALIAQARRALLADDGAWPQRTEVEPWITRSWQRCLSNGLHPAQHVAFGMVSASALRRSHETHQHLLRAARPVLEQLTRAIAGMRYFALLTDAHGTVIDVQGAVDSTCRRPQWAPPPSGLHWLSCSRCGCTGESIFWTTTTATAARVPRCSIRKDNAWACWT
jgi:hypothetical protein